LQLGLEQTPEEYITKLVEIFREVRRVLRDDGTCWIVIDDSYASAPGNSNFAKSTIGNTYNYHMMRKHGVTDKTKLPNTKHKDMIGIPWMLAVALRADGWWLRSDIIWQKPVHMPESVTDRPTSSYEHVFLLAKSKDYFWDDDAIAEPDKTVNASRGPDPTWDYGSMSGGNEGLRRMDQRYHYTEERPMRNVRDVWTIPVEPFMFKLPGDDLSHFATFPKQLVERCVKAGTSEMGCCPTCGAPYDRVTSKGELDTNNVALMTVISRSGGNDYAEYHGHSQKGHINAGVQDSSELKSSILRGMRPKKHEWAQTCKCLPQPAVPCWVLDPFGGTGTTGLVAAMQCTPNGQPRHATLIELNPKYVRLARQRIITESMGNVDVIIEEQA
jgi:DNA modification methylase